jgi:hypothetical protein
LWPPPPWSKPVEAERHTALAVAVVAAVLTTAAMVEVGGVRAPRRPCPSWLLPLVATTALATASCRCCRGHLLVASAVEKREVESAGREESQREGAAAERREEEGLLC